MAGFFEDLRLAIEVLKDWRALAAIAAFLFAWLLVRYVATVYRKPRPAFRLRTKTDKAAKSAAKAPPAAPVDDEDEDEEFLE